MNSRESIRVAVAERSLILRSGVIAALKRSFSGSIQFIELETPEDFDRNIRLYSPNILVANPLFGGQFSVERCRQSNDLGLKETKIVALVSSIIAPQALQLYDASIGLYDTDEQLRELMDRLMGFDKTPEDAQPEGDEQLSQREKEIIVEVVKGKTNKEIAEDLSLSVFTVLTHRRNISRKLQIHSASALAIYAIANKLVKMSDIK